MHYYTDVLKKYAVFSGRTSKKQYWMFILFNSIFALVASFLDGVFNTNSIITTTSGQYGLIHSLYSLALLLPSIAAGVRRLHDVGRTGKWILVPFLSLPFFLLMLINFYLGIILALLFLFGGVFTVLIFNLQKGTAGDNKYGPNPEDITEALIQSTVV